MKKKLLFLAVLSFSFLLILSGCLEEGVDNDLDRADSFHGYEEGSTWKYHHDFGETVMDEMEFITVHKVIDIKEKDDSNLFYVKYYQQEDYDPDGKFWGDIYELKNDNLSYWGSFTIENEEISENPFYTPSFLISENLEVGDEGFNGLELKSKSERVSVSAGVFDAWYFEYLEEQHGGRYFEGVWFVPYIGIVKEEFSYSQETDDGWEVWEEETIELIDFQP